MRQTQAGRADTASQIKHGLPGQNRDGGCQQSVADHIIDKYLLEEPRAIAYHFYNCDRAKKKLPIRLGNLYRDLSALDVYGAEELEEDDTDVEEGPGGFDVASNGSRVSDQESDASDDEGSEGGLVLGEDKFGNGFWKQFA